MASALYGCTTNMIGAVFLGVSVTFVMVSILHWAVVMVAITAIVVVATLFASSKELTINRG